MNVLRTVLAFFALQTCWFGVRYLLWGDEGMPLPYEDRFLPYRSLVVVHGFAGMTALLAGGLQFRYFRPWHRALGRVYMLAVMVAAVTGLPMALKAAGGFSAQTSFVVLDLAWVSTAGLAWRTAVRGRIGDHRRWMSRNYALTYSAVLLRLLLNGLRNAGWGFDQIYPVVSWSWVSALAVAELMWRRKR